MQKPDHLIALLDIARDLTSSLVARDRYDRLLSAARRIIPCDAACLLLVEGETLVPLAGHGLSPEALVRRYRRQQHPRLDAILRADEPVLFAADSPLPDPFDGLLESDPWALSHIHACLGCRLTDRGRVVGALTADALAADAFDGLDMRVVATLGALAGAALSTTALIETLERTAERRGRVARELQRSAAQAGGGQILGDSPAVTRLRDEIRMVAGSDLAVLITGETGVGKELVARHLHQASPRRDEALIHVNCAALPESLAESELFGHVAGAFTGAAGERAGKFEVADGGTLLLDEVGELPLALQPKLLRALQEGEIQRVGSDRPLKVDVRILAATNRDLEREVAAGRFRADLYHRLAVYPIRVPPLRERREDVPMLAAHFLDQARHRLGVPRLRLAPDARERLTAADWPGNVRELENVVSRGALRAVAGRSDERETVIVETAHLDIAGSAGPPAGVDTMPGHGEPLPPGAAGLPPGAFQGPLRDRIEAFRTQVIADALRRHDGSWAAAARELGMHRGNLYNLARRLGIRPGD